MPLVNQTGYAVIRTAIFQWARDRSGVGSGKVLWVNQPTPRPAEPFLTLQILSRGRARGFDQVKEVQNGNVIERTYIGLREMIVQVGIYTVPADDDTDLEALEMLEQALGALSAQQVVDSFRTANLAFLDHEDIMALDEQLGERWQRRATADVRFSYRSVLFDDGTDPVPDDGTFIENVEPITEDAGNATFNL